MLFKSLDSGMKSQINWVKKVYRKIKKETCRQMKKKTMENQPKVSLKIILINILASSRLKGKRKDILEEFFSLVKKKNNTGINYFEDYSKCAFKFTLFQ